MERRGPTERRERRPSSWSVLRYRNYALLFWGQLVSSLGSEIRLVVVMWQVYLLTHSALALGLIGLFQALPRLFFSLLAGVFADAFDRRALLLIINGAMAVLSTVLALCTLFNIINMVIIYVVILLITVVASFEYPTRQAMIPGLVPRERMPDATSISMVMAQLTSIIGPTVGGFAIAWLGVANSYWLDVLSYVGVLVALILMVVPRVAVESRGKASLGALVDGLRFMRAHPVILSVITLDFFAIFFGAPFALLPVFASDILHAGSQGLGILLAANGVGALLVTPFTGRISHIARQGLGVVVSIVLFSLCIMAFGLFPNALWLAVLLLAGAGAADMVSMLLRFLIIPLITPDEFRGRVSAVNAMFAIGGTQLGNFESGLVASFTSPQIAVVSGGAICLLSLIVIVARVPTLLHVRVK